MLYGAGERIELDLGCFVRFPQHVKTATRNFMRHLAKRPSSRQERNFLCSRKQMPDGVFEFIPDEFATRHIFVADSTGSFAVFDFLVESREALCGSVCVVFADDGMDMEVIGVLLRVLEVENIEIFPSRIYAVRHLQSLLSPNRIGTRLYVAGTETLYGLVAQLCEAMGMDSSAVVIAR